MVTGTKWRAAAVLTAVLSKGKAVRKMLNRESVEKVARIFLSNFVLV